MRKHLLSAALAAFMLTAAAGSAEAYEHWHGGHSGYYHGGYHGGYYHGGYYGHPYWGGPVVVGAGYYPYAYAPAPYYPAPAPFYPAPYAAPVGLSLGFSLR